MNTDQLAALGGLITAVGVIVTGVLSTRSKVKLDDIATMQRRLDQAEEKLEAEKAARAADSARAQTHHDAQIRVYEQEIASLTARLEERNDTITHLDGIILRLRTYVSRLRQRLLANNIDLPDEPPGMND